MVNIMLSGVGGQGTVLAAKVLAQAAQDKGWQVRTAETIGMAQRGGSVVSHVRMGDQGEEVLAPLLGKRTADMIIAFEPAEGARVLPYLAPGGTMVCAQTALQPVTSALSSKPYEARDVLNALHASLGNAFLAVDDERIINAVGTRKALNTVLLTCAVATGCLPLGIEDLKQAVAACVKPAFVEMNLAAVDVTLAELGKR